LCHIHEQVHQCQIAEEGRHTVAQLKAEEAKKHLVGCGLPVRPGVTQMPEEIVQYCCLYGERGSCEILHSCLRQQFQERNLQREA